MIQKDSMERAVARAVFYVQYTNPGAYPPLQHSAHLFANAGWNVVFFGTGASGATELALQAHPKIRVDGVSFQSAGIAQKLQYLRYAWRVLATCFNNRPHLIYASDPLSCPVALLLSLVHRIPVVYHEHDSPLENVRSPFMKAVLWARRILAGKALLNVLPNAERGHIFVSQTQAARDRIRIVWNCPSIGETYSTNVERTHLGLRLYYHGSINVERMPFEILDALVLLPDCVRFRFLGYETIGSTGYVDAFLSRASVLGVRTRVEYLGIKQRREALAIASTCDVGWACVPMRSDDINMKHMVGASNKAFDYLLAGCTLLVSPLREWEETFVSHGVAASCDPRHPKSIAHALRCLLDCSSERNARAKHARRAIHDRWNYETQFEKVFAEVRKLGTPSG